MPIFTVHRVGARAAQEHGEKTLVNLSGIASGTRRRICAAALALLGITALVAAGDSRAQQGTIDPPTISGTPIVGQTLTASGASVYKWQRCATNCTSAGAVFVDIPGTGGQGRDTYVLTGADLGMWIRVQGKGAPQGTKFVASAPVGPVLAPPSGIAPEVLPEHGVHLLGEPTEGVVRFKPPGQEKFTTLSGRTVIPVGSIINTRKGTILLIAATGEFGNRNPDNAMEFFDGLFKIKQADETNAPALAKLMGKLRCGDGGKKGAAAAAAAGPTATAAARRRRGLWGRGRGSYGTRGRGGTGSVVGTTWFTKDTCDGTFWKVTEGVGISVDPKGKKKDVFLGPGESYFAED
jgi:hypothetical protein